MATERQQQPQQQQQQQQPALAALSLPREQQQQQQLPPLPPGSSGKGAVVAEGSQSVEFRGFEYFSQRDLNEYRDASRAYFAEKNANPSSWLGDATPPASAHPSLDGPRPPLGELTYSSDDGQPGDGKRILGLRRPWFWTILAIIVVIIIVAVGVGVGVGVGAKQSTKNISKAGSGTGLGSDVTETTMSATGTPTISTGGVMMETPSSAPTPTGSTVLTTPGSKAECPQVNGTIYKVPGSTKRFLQLCGVDYGKEDGAVDIRNVYTDTAADCIENCAGTATCTGCGWGFIDGDVGPPYRCWLKRKVENNTPHTADASWHFGVLL